MNRLEIDGTFESNPFRPDMPEEARDNPSEAFDFLREQAENLRRTHNLNQAGDTTFSWEILTQLEDRPRFTLGSIGRFFHPLYGMIFARYVLFDQIDPALWTGAPYGSNKGLEQFDWSVTNQLERSFNDFVIGIGASYVIPVDGQYGWVIVNGINIQELLVWGVDPPRWAKFSWFTSGYVAAIADTSGPPIGRIISEPVNDDGWRVPPAGAYIDCLTLQQSSTLGAQFAAIEELIQQAEISNDINQQVLYESIRRIQTDFTYSDTIVGQAIRSITDRLTAVVNDRVTITQEVRDSIQLLVNYSAGARVDATNAGEAASRAHTKLTATNEFARTASISAGEAGVFAESATVMRNEATLFRNEAGVSAAAAVVSAQSASVSETNAGISAAAALTHETNAATSAGLADTSADNAAVSAANANSSAGQASTSATQASNSATAADGSASTASAQATTATNAATSATNSANTATTQASNASTSASNASTSASNSAGSAANAVISATAASASQSGATQVARQLLPFDFAEDGRHWSSTFVGENANVTAPLTNTATFGTEAGIGRVAILTFSQAAASRDVGQAGYMTWKPNRNYRVTSKSAFKVNDGTNDIQLYLTELDSNFNFIGSSQTILAVNAGDVGWKEVILNRDSDLVTAGTVYLRAMIRHTSTNGAGNKTVYVHSVKFDDVTEVIESGISAAASATSASQASTSATGAAASATSATTQANNAATSAGNSATSASNASTSAAAASTSAASAATSAILSANLAQASLNKNPVFARYALTTTPDDWPTWINQAQHARIGGGLGRFGSDYRMRQTVAADADNVGIFQLVPVGTGYVFIEATIESVAGPVTGAGVLIQWRDAANGHVSSVALRFDTDRTSTGGLIPGAGVYNFSKLVQVPATAVIAETFLMGNYSTGFLGTPKAKTLDWMRVVIAPANAAVVAMMLASVSATGNALAAWEITTVAGSSSAAIRMRTESSPGVYDSTIALEAEEFQVFNGTDRAPALKISGGKSLFSGDVQVNGAVLIGNRRIPIALQSFQVLAADGETVEYGTDLVNLPTLMFETDGLAAKTAAQAYDVKALSQTSTNFVMRAKILTVGSGSSVSSGPGTNTGGSPSWQMDKTDAADSYNSNYTFTVTMNITFSSGEPGFYEAVGEYECFVRPSGGAWTSIGSIQKFFINGTQTTLSKVITGTLSFGNVIGQHGSDKEFGILASQGVITAFTSVVYTKQGTSGESSATPSGEKVRVTVIPNNS